MLCPAGSGDLFASRSAQHPQEESEISCHDSSALLTSPLQTLWKENWGFPFQEGSEFGEVRSQEQSVYGKAKNNEMLEMTSSQKTLKRQTSDSASFCDENFTTSQRLRAPRFSSFQRRPSMILSRSTSFRINSRRSMKSYWIRRNEGTSHRFGWMDLGRELPRIQCRRMAKRHTG